MSLLLTWPGHSNTYLLLFSFLHLWAVVLDNNNLYSVLLMVYYFHSELTVCCSRHIHSLHSCHLLWLWTWEGTVSHLSYRLPLGSGHVEPILSHARSSLFHGNKWDMIAWSGVSFKQTTLLSSYFDTCSLLRLHFCTLSALLLWVPGWLFYCLLFFHPRQFSDALLQVFLVQRGNPLYWSQILSENKI